MAGKRAKEPSTKKITAIMPSVASHEFSYRNLNDLKEKVCKKFGIEKKLTRLIQLTADKVIVDYIWARQMIMLGARQSLIRRSKLVIVGAGALGSELAKNSALLGFGTLKIVDFDTVELSNMSRGLFTKTDLGRGKAEALAAKIRATYPYVKVKSVAKRVENCSEKELCCDIILCGLDNMAARFWLAKFAFERKIPLIDGGILGLKARVQVMLPGGPCLACAIPLSSYGTVAGLKNPCENSGMEENKIASFSTLASMVAAIQVNEAMKVLLNMNPLKGVLIVDLEANAYHVMKLNRNKKCFICGKAENINDKGTDMVFEEVVGGEQK